MVRGDFGRPAEKLLSRFGWRVMALSPGRNFQEKCARFMQQLEQQRCDQPRVLEVEKKNGAGSKAGGIIDLHHLCTSLGSDP